MRSSALADALKDFGARRNAVPEPFAPPQFQFDEQPHLVADVDQFHAEIDVDTAVNEAVANAEHTLRQALEAEHAQALEAERARHAEELSAAQALFAEEAPAQIAARIEEMEQRLLDLTGAVTARILGVVLTDDVRDRSLDRLRSIVVDALRDDEAVRIHVRGSLPLFESLKSRLPQYADQIDFAETGGFDLSVTINDSVFETRLAEWSASLSEALA